MATDPIIEELHRIREEIAAQFDYDVFAIGAMLQAKQQEGGRAVVSFATQPNESEAERMDDVVIAVCSCVRLLDLVGQVLNLSHLWMYRSRSTENRYKRAA